MPAQTVIKLRRDIAADWELADPILAEGELGIETNTNRIKIGDGATEWTGLAYGPVSDNLHIRVKNASGSVAIPAGRLVQFAGAAGDTVTASPAITDGSVDFHSLIGVTAAEIAADGFGDVVLTGTVSGLNTSALGNVGELLYADPANAGLLTNQVPAAPAFGEPVAAIVKSGSGSSGQILVRLHIGASLNDIHDVALSSVSTGQVLQFDGAKWVNATLDALPDQSGNDGKYLTTDGTDASWAAIDLSTKQDVVAGVSDTEIGYLANVTSDIQAQIDSTVKNPNPSFVINASGFIYSENGTGENPVEAPILPQKSNFSLDWGGGTPIGISAADGPDNLGGTWFRSTLVGGSTALAYYRPKGSSLSYRYDNTQVWSENLVQVVSSYPRGISSYAHIAHPQFDSNTFNDILRILQYNNGSLVKSFDIPELGQWNDPSKLIAAYDDFLLAVVDSTQVHWIEFSGNDYLLSGSATHGISNPTSAEFARVGFSDYLQVSNGTNYALIDLYGTSLYQNGSGYYVPSFSNPVTSFTSAIKVAPSGFTGIEFIDPTGWNAWIWLNQEFNTLSMTNRSVVGLFIEGEQPTSFGRPYILIYNSQTSETEIYATNEVVSFIGNDSITVNLIGSVPGKKFLSHSGLLKSLTIGDLLP